MNPIRRTNILGYSILNESAAHVAEWVCDELAGGPPKSFVFLNPHSIVVADREPVFRNAIEQASGIFCDGVGLSLAARWLNHTRVHRVYGFEFFFALSKELSRRRAGRIFFLGGSPDSIEHLRERYRDDFPGVEQINSYSPPYKDDFSDDEVSEMGRRIVESGSQVLWVGLGSPKQEKILHRLMLICPVNCGAAVGAVFDFYTGRVPHSPAWIRNLGLQWAHRLMLEPRRLWRRTLVSMPIFLWRVLREGFNGRRLPR